VNGDRLKVVLESIRTDRKIFWTVRMRAGEWIHRLFE
jgi:hypothetical protein